METRNVAITLEKAREWYKGCNSSLKEIALQAFTKEEPEEFNFKNITTFGDAVKALNLNDADVLSALANLKVVSKASAASFKLNIIRKALNKGKKMDFKKGTVWYPYTPAVLPNNNYCKDSWEVEVGKVRIGCDTFTLLGGSAGGTVAGLGHFDSSYGVAYSTAHVGFLGCATKEIAQHMGKYFGKEIFEAKYGDLVDYEWV